MTDLVLEARELSKRYHRRFARRVRVELKPYREGKGRRAKAEEQRRNEGADVALPWLTGPAARRP
jgi:hypothetical protein